MFRVSVLYRIILCFTLFWSGGILLFAQSSGIQFKHIAVNEGLSSNHVTSIFKASDGFMWMGTPTGLNRYDGHSIKVYKNQAGNLSSLKDNSVEGVFEGPQNTIWVRTSQGINVLDIHKDHFVADIDNLLKTWGLPAGNYIDIKKDKKGNFWFLHLNQGLFVYKPKENQSIKYKSVSSKVATGMAIGAKNTIWVIFEDGSFESLYATSLATQKVKKLNLGTFSYRIFVDALNDPWVYSTNTSLGVFWWSDLSASPTVFSTSSPEAKLNNNTVMAISQDMNGRIWIATDHGGVNLYNPKTQKMSYLVHEDFNERSLSHNGTSSLLCDADGMVWVGTYKGGLSYYHENLIQFPVIKHHRNIPASLPYDDVNRVVEDASGNLWIGTNGGGLIFYDKAKNTYTQYLNKPGDASSLGSNVIVSLLLDKDQNLWVGTYHGGLNLFKNGRFIRYVVDFSKAKGISNNSIWEIFQDSKDRMWIGTLSGGVNLFDPKTGVFTQPRGANGPSSSYISSIMEDRKGNIWFGTATGIEILEASGKKVLKYSYDPKNDNGLSHNYISDILQDTKGRIWIATREGLNLFDSSTEKFKVLSESDGLSDNTIHTILEDDFGKIWVSTSKGISVITEGKSDEWIIQNFDQHDGLQSVAFNENAAVKLRSGELIFGGPMGFNRIKPNEFSNERQIPQPILVDFLLFNKSLKPAEKISGKQILDKAIQYTEKVVLRHDQNVFSLTISPLYYLHPDRIKVRYILEGFNKEWLDLDTKSRLAPFTNLNAGTYKFKVIVSTDGEVWSEPFTLLTIEIKPPFWLSGWAYAFYALSILGILMAVRYLERKRQESRFILQQEREEARRFKELDQLKTKFFTNVSHEFRTPVSLIISPIEKLVNMEEDPNKKSHLVLVHKNARRLLNLVNQLLDFRKVDTQSLHLQNTEGDILAQILDYARSFQDMAENKKIDFNINVPTDALVTAFDHDKMERIVFNLLSNAFKFTPVGGAVSITAEVVDSNKSLKIVVEDSGIGISEEAKTRIFERYYQGDILKPLLNQGSGIGLAITKEYVNLLDGTLHLESVLNEGSSFIVTLPLNQGTVLPEVVQTVSQKKGNVGGHKILVVEDNDDFRFYLMDNLKEFYHTEEARNFTEGWEKALAFHPDIIVSDVSMPGNTGIELCKKLKADARTVHIPVILLTALTAENYQLAGIDAGASDYIVKPFNVELLLSKIKSHINQRASFEKTYKKQLTIDPSEMELESADQKFIRKALDIVEKNIANSLFSVEILADQMNVSRVGLYKRILTLSGYSPSEFIRNIRLKRAAQLLEETGMTVAEVAYEVGFNNPKVFSKYFKDIFGKIPSEYRKEHS
jgi:ligand-binding sensor domain-containing protein/signal transduction histidine kinase/DNA-binding response OmpR family regulator